ncbi:MAG: hypothetical protein M2R45_00455 [Verrucomicrobia subdivision 3 bacterium]|nr:hypothetical protein [Limisphaerales bacterium]MCS1413665.1 hypothetical protein [Limisphaerales bacterium]
MGLKGWLVERDPFFEQQTFEFELPDLEQGGRDGFEGSIGHAVGRGYGLDGGLLGSGSRGGAAGSYPVALANRHGVNADVLKIWLGYLDIGLSIPIEVAGHFRTKVNRAVNYDSVTGRGSYDTPPVMANSFDSTVWTPGRARAHSVAVHPAPTLFAAVSWQSPVDGVVCVIGKVKDAHTECSKEWLALHGGPRADELGGKESIRLLLRRVVARRLGRSARMRRDIGNGLDAGQAVWSVAH